MKFFGTSSYECFKEIPAETYLSVLGEHANNRSRNALCKFNSIPYIWFPSFKLTLFNHTEADIKRCSGKKALGNTSEGVQY